MKSTAEIKRQNRARMRNAGFTLKQLWCHPADWPAVLKYSRRLRARRQGEKK